MIVLPFASNLPLAVPTSSILYRHAHGKVIPTKANNEYNKPRVQGKGNTERTVFLSNDARLALADYLERERPRDVAAQTTALFLSATGIPERAADGRLSPRAVNLILTQIGHCRKRC